MRVAEKNSGAFVIEHFLTPAMCQHYIALGEEAGFVPSEVNFRDGSRRAEDVRNNDRVIFDDTALADSLFDRARELLPATIDGWTLCGLNERFRYYRYGPGEYFKWHRDGVFARSPDEESRLTFMIYLNADFEGGDTEFRTEFIKPQQGAVLVFPHKLSHQGTEVTEGLKYVLRTDVMYRRAESRLRAAGEPTESQT
ncbi:2OG-Fe(II) oxygenase [Massilia violaceinigra]|uniref:2OG-Fe(II) oxygenase n=2 Tax=Massilia violaceinigra TaxID=2045208 RepID=A0ABY4AEI4_9BURK|nr:2OG-Fe(II) oxygenase [Massilia violaceinigra]